MAWPLTPVQGPWMLHPSTFSGWDTASCLFDPNMVSPHKKRTYKPTDKISECLPVVTLANRRQRSRTFHLTTQKQISTTFHLTKPFHPSLSIQKGHPFPPPFPRSHLRMSMEDLQAIARVDIPHLQPRIVDDKLGWWYCWWFRNPVITRISVGSLHPNGGFLLGISSINSIILAK